MVSWQQYAAGWANQHGGYDLRRGPTPVRGWLWFAYALARGLTPLRVRPGSGFVCALACAAAVPVTTGRGPLGLLLAALLVTLSAFAATVDAALTVLTGGGSPRAAIRATVAARLGELAGLFGCWLVGVPAVLVIACGALAVLHEAVRREALVAGLSRVALQTVGERPMRVAAMATGLGLAGLAWLIGLADAQLAAGTLTVALVVWLTLGLLGLWQLTGIVRRTLA